MESSFNAMTFNIFASSTRTCFFSFSEAEAILNYLRIIKMAEKLPVAAKNFNP